MIRSLIGLPFRLGARWTGIAVHGTAEVADRAFGLVGLVSHTLSGPRQPDVDLDGSPHDAASARRPGASGRRSGTSAPGSGASIRRSGSVPGAPPAPPRVPADAPVPPVAPEAPAPPPPVVAPEASAPSRASDLDTPDHVSEEATVVDSVAEAGAEDGAGAQIRVAEPWEGYRQMKADDVIDRLTGSPTAVLAAVGLYERSERGRQSILAAVERELRRADS